MSLHTNRRILLTSALATSVSPWAFAQPATLRQRERVYGAARPSSLNKYKAAVTALLALPPSDPRNWYRLAILHILDCPHRNWWFLPWHRGYLHQFEQICAHAINQPDFALPYWDWTQSPTIPDAFFDGEFNTSNATRFIQTWLDFEANIVPAVNAMWTSLDPQRKAILAQRGYGSVDDLISGPNGLAAHFAAGQQRDVTAQAPTLPAAQASTVKLPNILACLAPSTFEGFAGPKASHHSDMMGEGPLETGPHDNVHGGLGGFMSAWLSPIDPIFWLHHANLDRLWDAWIRRRTARNQNPLPQQPADRQSLLQEPYLFFVDPTGQSITRAASDYMDSRQLGYKYEPGAGDVISRPPPNIASGNRSFFTTGRLTEAFRINREASARIEVSPEVLQSAITDAAETNLYARIVIAPPNMPGLIRFRVYVNCPYLSVHTPVEDDHYVGTITPFDAPGGMGEHHTHEETFALPLNPALERLGARGNLPRSALRIQLIAEARRGEEHAEIMTGGIREIVVEER